LLSSPAERQTNQNGNRILVPVHEQEIAAGALVVKETSRPKPVTKEPTDDAFGFPTSHTSNLQIEQ
jgi:hypothetical protein